MQTKKNKIKSFGLILPSMLITGVLLTAGCVDLEPKAPLQPKAPPCPEGELLTDFGDLSPGSG
ncbi:MAG: hypothetical protein DRO11_07910, partial [Methanobacteriota archaeon]